MKNKLTFWLIILALAGFTVAIIYGFITVFSPSPTDTLQHPESTTSDARTKHQTQPTPETVSTTPQNQHEVLAIEAAEIMHTWNPVEDTSRSDAIIRAMDYFTQEFQDSFIPAPRASGAEWTQAAQINAKSVPEINVVRTHQDDYVVELAITWHWEDAQGKKHKGDTQDQPRFITFVFNDKNKIVDFT